MALAALLGALEREHGAQVDAIRAAAQDEASAIRDAARRARAARVAAAANAFAAARRADADRELAATAHRARADLLGARAAMLERVRDAVRVLLPARVAQDPELANTLAAAAHACVGDGSGAVVARGPTGTVIELPSGVRVEATLDALLDREWPLLACEALALERAS